MATTSSTSSASTNAIQALGAGSGIDVKSLAQSLAESEVAPQKDRISSSITKTEARISGYGALSLILRDLKTAFEKLNDASDFGSLVSKNTQPSAFSATLGSSVGAGTHQVNVLQMSAAQRSLSAGFTSSSADINNGQDLKLQLSLPGSATPTEITVAQPASLDTIIQTINSHSSAQSAGISAELVQYNSRGVNYFAMELKGGVGENKAFVLGIDATSYQGNLSAAPLLQDKFLQEAANAKVLVNGQLFSQSSNSVTGAIPGVTLELAAVTSSPAQLSFSRDTQSTKDNIKSLVQAYNDFDQSLKILEDRKSEVETLGGSLAGDSLVRSIRSQMRNLMVSESSTPGTRLTAARDIGISFDRNGRLTLDESKLNTALAGNFEDISKFFSAGTNNKSLFSNQAAGIAGDAVVKIDKMLRSTGQLAQQTESANKDLAKYKSRLKDLDARLEKLLERYTNQFSLMESVVGNSNSLRSSLTSTFEGMMAAYTR